MNDDIITKIALERIADALEEILRLVKQDMERMKKLNEEPEEGDMRDHFTKATINE
jgi:coenzyme F420-reducing hydrogenase alpha subunit